MKKLFGLVGASLGHSFSQRFFNDYFKREGIDAEYLNFELTAISEFQALIASHPQLQGVNITIPYKEAVIPHLTSLSEEAREIGAVNVVKIVRDDTGAVVALEGHNTDASGFQYSLSPLLSVNARHALVIGNGGASKAVVYALKGLGLLIDVVARHPKSGEWLLGELPADLINDYDVIINATPLGTFPNGDEAPDIPYHAIRYDTICFDLVYNPPVTGFLHHAAPSGATLKSGLAMLIAQAEAAWLIWTGEEMNSY